MVLVLTRPDLTAIEKSKMLAYKFQSINQHFDMGPIQCYSKWRLFRVGTSEASLVSPIIGEVPINVLMFKKKGFELTVKLMRGHGKKRR